MEKSVVVLIVALCSLTGCNKTSGPAGSNGAAGAPKPADALQQKLVENSRGRGTDCGRLDVHAAEGQLKTASDCAMAAAQAKRAFYVAYDMPGMSVGVAGNAEGKLFSVQSQSAGAAPELTSGACPSALRVASSGRVTCFAPGDMGSMGGGHMGTTAPGMTNPHPGSSSQPPSKKP
jgi:hypothetical protein